MYDYEDYWFALDMSINNMKRDRAYYNRYQQAIDIAQAVIDCQTEQEFTVTVYITLIGVNYTGDGKASCQTELQLLHSTHKVVRII